MSSPLPERVHTFGQDLKRRYGARLHKLAINAGLACPNRDGSKGRALGATKRMEVKESWNSSARPVTSRL
jgi:radical SAM superfamily enzyme